MLHLPKGDVVFYQFPVKSIILSEFLGDSPEPQLAIAEMVNANTAIIATGSNVETAFSFSETIQSLGQITLDLIINSMSRLPSHITMARLTPMMHEFYKNFISSELRHANLSTNFISFWRFAQTIQSDFLTGIITLQTPNETLYSVFNSGAMTGGWLVQNDSNPSMPLSATKVLEIAVKLVGRIDFYETHIPSTIEPSPEMIFERTSTFQKIFDLDSHEHFEVKKNFGEVGIEIAMYFDGRRSLAEIARISTRAFGSNPLERAKVLAKLMMEFGMLTRRLV